MALLGFSKVTPDQVFEEDIIIAIMGPTGSGKSTFISCLTNIDGIVGHGTSSHTQRVEAFRLHDHPTYKDNLVLVDTPGFNDTYRSDMEILSLIGDWLQKTYKENVKLTGTLYLHDISLKRMSFTVRNIFHVFRRLCGDRALEKAVLVTTNWDTEDKSKWERREAELLECFWNFGGAVHNRFHATTHSGWEIVDGLVRRASGEKQALLLQEELVSFGLDISNTSAGRALEPFPLKDATKQ